jgi:hypothetical protein
MTSKPSTKPKRKPLAKPQDPAQPKRLIGWANPTHPMHRPAGGGPPRPFQPGNLVPVTHGAKSPQVVDAIAAHYLAEAKRMLGVDPPSYVQEPTYQRAVIAWARSEARVDLVSAWIADHGELDQDGNPWPAARFLSELEAGAAKRRQELGLTPASRAALGRDVASAGVDLARMWAAGSGKDAQP